MTTSPREFDTRAILTAGLLGAGAAAVLNVLLHFGTLAAGVNMVGQYAPATPRPPCPSRWWPSHRWCLPWSGRGSSPA